MTQCSKVPYFRRFVIQNFPFIEADFDALNTYQLLCKVVEYLNKVIKSQNETNENVVRLQENFVELQNYVEHYFDNLDVQEEINNKLDQMAEDGQLTELITAYLNLKSQLCFDSVDDMKLSENLVDGSFARTYGFYDNGDGGGAIYKIRTVTNEDVVDEKFIIALADNTLVAELIVENNILNVKQIGAKGDGETDDSSVIQAGINKCDNIYIPNGVYLCNSSLTTKDNLVIKGEETSKYNTSPVSKLKFAGNGLTGSYSYRVENLNIEGSWVDSSSPVTRGIYQARIELLNSSISKFTAGLDTLHVSTVINTKIYHNKLGINGMIDSNITNSYIYDNLETGINLFQGCNDNTISNNKIEWNGEHGVGCYRGYNNVISNNIIDRNGRYGVLLNDCSANTVTGNVLRRNYASQDGNGDTYSHIRIENVTGAIISSNYTAKGAKNDDGTGAVVPATAIYLTTSNDVQLIGNDFRGGNNKELATYNNGTYYRLDNVKTPSVLFSENYMKNLPNSGVVSASGNRTFTFKQISPNGIYDLPTYREVVVRYRKTDNASWGAEKFMIAVKQTSSAPAYSVSVKNERDGTNTITTNLTCSATFDGTNVSFTVSNTGTGEFGVAVSTIA